MSLIERFLKDELFIDFGAEVLYGDDQMYLDYPRRFATVSFQLMSTGGLCQIDIGSDALLRQWMEGAPCNDDR